jgi:hypothetical protein
MHIPTIAHTSEHICRSMYTIRTVLHARAHTLRVPKHHSVPLLRTTSSVLSTWRGLQYDNAAAASPRRRHWAQESDSEPENFALSQHEAHRNLLADVKGLLCMTRPHGLARVQPAAREPSRTRILLSMSLHGARPTEIDTCLDPSAARARPESIAPRPIGVAGCTNGERRDQHDVVDVRTQMDNISCMLITQKPSQGPGCIAADSAACRLSFCLNPPDRLFRKLYSGYARI